MIIVIIPIYVYTINWKIIIEKDIPRKAYLKVNEKTYSCKITVKKEVK